MFLQTRIPTSFLNNYIELLVHYTGFEPDYPATRMLPEGTVELLIPLDDVPRVFYKEAGPKEVITSAS